MIKIWLLISMVSMPGWPSVKHNAEVWFDETKCENRRIEVENKLYDIGSMQGHEVLFVQTWCLESDMFVLIGS